MAPQTRETFFLEFMADDASHNRTTKESGGGSGHEIVLLGRIEQFGNFAGPQSDQPSDDNSRLFSDVALGFLVAVDGDNGSIEGENGQVGTCAERIELAPIGKRIRVLRKQVGVLDRRIPLSLSTQFRKMFPSPAERANGDGIEAEPTILGLCGKAFRVVERGRRGAVV